MRLERIEAVRYGRMRDATLDGLGQGLTVVLGPNEAGKSTYTSLVRHVLFGYPTAARKEPGYFVPGGDGRLGRLVFGSADGRWVLERSEGPHGGSVRTRALAGPERPALHDELTRGVSALAYRIVFGFGLDEMAAIEEQRTAGDDVLSRLYAASAGLRVSPHEVRAALEKSAGEVFTPGGRKREFNAVVAELREVRAGQRALRARNDEFAADQERLTALSERLPGLREALERSRAELTELAVAVDRADERLTAVQAQEESLIVLRQERRRLVEEFEAIVLDEALLAAAPELDALLDEAPVHVESLRSLETARAAVERASSRAGDAAGRTGLGERQLEGFDASHDDAAAIEEAREAMQRLELQVESRAEASDRAAAVRAQGETAAERMLVPLGIVADDPADAIAERLAALEALEAARATTVTGRGAGLDLPSIVMLASGILALAAGGYLHEWVTAGIGGVLVLAGLWFLLRARQGVPTALSDDERAALRILGLEADAGTLDLSRMRRALENARAAVAALEEMTRAAAEAERDVSLARGALGTRVALWKSWLDDHGLPSGLSPAMAATALASAREARVARQSETELREDLARRSSVIDEYIARLRTAAEPLMELPQASGREDLPALVNRIKERLATERAHAARADELMRDIRPADARIAAEEARLERARSDIREILERFDLTEGGTIDDLRVRCAAAQRSEAESATAFESLVSEISGLETRLAQGAREQKGIELALAESGLVERLNDAVDRYLVDSCAARLLADAQQRYERERQPEVVREAGRLFSTMTKGRYQNLTVPLDEGRIEAFDTRAAAHTSDVLSRGTAEQLYLSIRLGLIARLGDVGAALPVLMDDVLVNFDPERREGAAEAIAQLAAERQVIFFTCHPETAAVFSRVAGDHTLLEIDRVGA